MSTLFGGLGDGHRHPAILEGAGGIEPLVLEIDLAAGDLTQLGRMNEWRGALAQGNDRRGIGDGKILAVA